MTKKTKRKPRPYNQLYFITNTQRKREVRDVFNKLRKKYNLQTVYECIRVNYHLQPGGVDWVLSVIDKEPVDLTAASIQYQTIMREDFHL